MEQFYVSVSRGRQAVSIYTDDKEQLSDAFSQSVERTSATELMAKRNEQAQGINRPPLFKQQEKVKEPYNHLTSNMRNNGLPATSRTEQDYTR